MHECATERILKFVFEFQPRNFNFNHTQIYGQPMKKTHKIERFKLKTIKKKRKTILITITNIHGYMYAYMHLRL